MRFPRLSGVLYFIPLLLLAGCSRSSGGEQAGQALDSRPEKVAKVAATATPAPLSIAPSQADRDRIAPAPTVQPVNNSRIQTLQVGRVKPQPIAKSTPSRPTRNRPPKPKATANESVVTMLPAQAAPAVNAFVRMPGTDNSHNYPLRYRAPQSQPQATSLQPYDGFNPGIAPMMDPQLRAMMYRQQVPVPISLRLPPGYQIQAPAMSPPQMNAASQWQTLQHQQEINRRRVQQQILEQQQSRADILNSHQIRISTGR